MIKLERTRVLAQGGLGVHSFDEADILAISRGGSGEQMLVPSPRYSSPGNDRPHSVVSFLGAGSYKPAGEPRDEPVLIVIDGAFQEMGQRTKKP